MSSRTQAWKSRALTLLLLGGLGCSHAPELQRSAAVEIPTIRLDIKAKHLESLTAKRDEALRLGELISTGDDNVPARLGVAGREVKARIRLTGESEEELRGERWPYRVTIGGGEAVLGMRRFALRAPEAVGGFLQPIFFDFLREQGVLAPRHLFVDLIVNGRPLGRMAMVEHFATELLERQQRRDGVIVRFDRGAEEGRGWRDTPLDAFGSGRVRRSSELSAQFEVAAGLIRGLAETRIQASDALDLETWSRFLAACEVWSVPALVHWKNLRMYVNAFTLRLEPIAFRATGKRHTADTLQCLGGREALLNQLMDDPRFRESFVQQLHATARQIQSDDFADWLREREQQEFVGLLEVARGRSTALEELRKRAKQLLRVATSDLPQGLADSPFADNAALPESSLGDFLAQHAYIRRSSEGWLELERRNVVVKGSLILPTGMGLRIEAGSRLRFDEGELLLARGPLEFMGTAEAPIVLEARHTRFSGVVHLGSDRPSYWSHVVVRGTEAPARGAWQLTGGVTFRTTEITLEDCSFEDSSAEDALNLVRSQVRLRRVAIRRTPSDAIDFDFCTGSAQQVHIEHAGGDGLDAAGSQLRFLDVTLEDIGDKAISVGEGSDIHASRIHAVRSGTGVASKDNSKTTIVDASFEETRIAGLMAYTKKSAYGPASIEARRVIVTGPGRRAIAQLGSRVILDSRTIESEAIDVEALYQAQETAQ